MAIQIKRVITNYQAEIKDGKIVINKDEYTEEPAEELTIEENEILKYSQEVGEFNRTKEKLAKSINGEGESFILPVQKLVQ